MNALDSVAAETLRSGRADWFEPALLEEPAAHPLDYAGAHWLSSFVLYLLTRNEGGIAPGQ